MLDPFQTPRPSRNTTLIFSAVILIVLLATSWKTLQGGAGENAYVAQSRALLAGRWDLGEQPAGAVFESMLDAATIDGRVFSAHPPAPLLFAVPLVAIFGAVPLTLVALALTALNVWLILRILNHIGVVPERALWTTAAFVLGTSYWLAVRDSAFASSFGHIVAVTFVLLALEQAYGRGSPWLTGLWLGLSFLSRPFTVLAAPFVLVALLAQIPGSAKQLWRAVAVFASMLIASIGLYALLNLLRFGTTLNGAPDGAPHGLYALPLVSTFLISAGFAQWGARSRAALWFSAGLIVLNLIWSQSNGLLRPVPNRHTLDFAPFLLIPVGIALNQAKGRVWLIWRGMITLSIAFSVLALLIA